MSKAQLKKYIASLSKAQLSEMVVEMYENSKAVKEYLEYYLNPDPEGELEKIKKKVYKEFFSSTGKAKRKPSFKTCNGYVTDFSKTVADNKATVELLIFYVSVAWNNLVSRYVYNESTYRTFSNVFRRLIDLMQSAGLEEEMKPKIQKILRAVYEGSPYLYNILMDVMAELDCKIHKDIE